MAIDTREKRASAIGMHFMIYLPLPDGTITQADRQQATGIYSGFGASSIWTVVTESNTVTWSSL